MVQEVQEAVEEFVERELVGKGQERADQAAQQQDAHAPPRPRPTHLLRSPL